MNAREIVIELAASACFGVERGKGIATGLFMLDGEGVGVVAVPAPELHPSATIPLMVDILKVAVPELRYICVGMETWTKVLGEGEDEQAWLVVEAERLEKAQAEGDPSVRESVMVVCLDMADHDESTWVHAFMTPCGWDITISPGIPEGELSQRMIWAYETEHAEPVPESLTGGGHALMWDILLRGLGLATVVHAVSMDVIARTNRTDNPHTVEAMSNA